MDFDVCWCAVQIFCHHGQAKCVYSSEMPDWLVFILLAAGYFTVMRWVLPKFGVPT